jgi:asparagine synthetase B (glutamine-hydrolysing)
MGHLGKSFFISTRRLQPELDGCVEVQVGQYWLGAFDDALLPRGGPDRVTLSFDTASLRKPGDESADGVENVAEIDGGALDVRGSDMNTQAIYALRAPGGHLVVFNDLYLARPLLRASGMDVRYEARARASDLTFFESVRRLRAGERLRAWSRRGAVDAQVSRDSGLLDPTRDVHADLERSMSELHGALERSVRRGVEGELRVHIALSGGVDSGTVASFIRNTGCPLTAFTLGTDWGDEYAEARQTADALGISLERIHVGAEELRREIHHVVRFFHFIEPENVEIALVAHCLYKKLFSRDGEPRRFLSGYGADLLNGGGITRCESLERFQTDLLQALERTQRSNEFSALAALQYGVRPYHPWWQREVIRCALQVPPAFKLRAGWDKFYARQMMVGRLPDAVAWRTKLGAHRGTGLSQHLRDCFGGDAPYRRSIERMHEDIFQNGLYPGGL